MLCFLTKMENFLCVYRNYNTYGRFIRALILARILIEISISATFASMFFDNYKHEYTTSDIIYSLLACTNSTALMILPLINSNIFKKLLCHLNSVSRYFKLDYVYCKNIKRKLLKLNIIVILNILAEGFVLISNCVSPGHDVTYLSFYLFIIIQIYSKVMFIRYEVEYYVLSSILVVMAEQLKALMRSIDKKRSSSTTQKFTDKVSSTPRPSQQAYKEFDEWTVIYTHIAECSKLLNSIFGIQLTIMVTTAIIFYVAMLYFLTDVNVKGSGASFATYLPVVQQLMHAVVIFYMLASTSQEVQNSGDNLKRQLSKLLIGTIKCKAEFKATRDLLRLVTTRPIRTQAFGSIDVNMSLLPTCLSFITGYTVIALQFNNVV